MNARQERLAREIMRASGLPERVWAHVPAASQLYRFLDSRFPDAKKAKGWIYLFPRDLIEAFGHAVVDTSRRTPRLSSFTFLDCYRPAQKRSKPAQQVDLLAAVFAVNRSAKRFRDAARSCYDSGTHGFARDRRLRKEQLYALKDAGIMAAVRTGRLAPVGKHGPLTVYRGEGYCFHSLLSPKGLELPALHFETSAEDGLYVESKPREAKEARLKDAVLTLESLPRDEDGFQRSSFPGPERVTSTQFGDDGDDDYSDFEDEDEDDV